MRSDWKECKIGDIGTVVGGATPSTKESKNYTDGTIAWITPKDLSDFHGRYISRGERNITEVGLKSCSAQLLPAGSVLFSSRAPIGYVAIAQNELCTNQGFKSIVPNSGTDSRFLYYLLKHNKDAIENSGNGTTFYEVSGSAMKNVVVRVPRALETQRKIASILSSLDDKIELNDRINANLEAQAKAIFKSWFVDFEPFGGKMPESWTTSDIYSIAKIAYGAPFSSKLFNTDGVGIPIVRIRDLKEQKFSTFTTEEHPRGRLIRAGDIVVGMDGEFRPYLWGNDPAWLNQRICIFENKRPKGKFFLLSTIRPLLERIEKTQVGTTVIHIGKKDFDAFRIQLPDENTLNKFDELTYPLFEKIIVSLRENARLSSLRDALLPRLLSGELDVSELNI